VLNCTPGFDGCAQAIDGCLFKASKWVPTEDGDLVANAHATSASAAGPRRVLSITRISSAKSIGSKRSGLFLIRKLFS
jgi:hypothetical protein